MRITDYDRVTSLAANDVFLLDGDRGTKTILVSDVAKETLKFAGYDRVTSLASNDVLLLDGDRGTKTILASNVVDETKVLSVSASSVTSLPKTIADSQITSDMLLVSHYISNPWAQGGPWTVTTTNGSVTISGTFNSGNTTTIRLYLQKSRN